MRVRLQARSSLLQYHWAGYRSKKDDGPVLQSNEPPMAGPAMKVQAFAPAPSPRSLVVPVNQAPRLQAPPTGANQGPDLSPPN